METGNNPNGETPTALTKPVLQKPPGYRDPAASPAPPRRPGPLSQTYHPRKGRSKRRSACRICCCCCCLGTILIVVILLIICGVLYLWFTPKPPTFHLQSFNVSSLNVAKRPDSSYLTAVTVARVEAKNPNGKLKYRYGKSDVTVTAGDGQGANLGSASLPGFSQGKNNVTVLRMEMRVKDQMVDDSVGDRLVSRFKAGTLPVHVEVKTSIGVEVWSLKIGKLGVTVKCHGAASAGSGGGGDSLMPKCTINTLRWINIY